MRKLLAAPDPAPALTVMEEIGVLAAILPGARAEAIARLVALEGRAHGGWLRRLATLGGPDPSQALRLSKAEARDLARLRDAIAGDDAPATLGYRLGRKLGADALFARAAQRGAPLPRRWYADLARGAAATFPLRPSDLMPALSGPALGAALKRAESHWIDADFTPDREALRALALQGDDRPPSRSFQSRDNHYNELCSHAGAPRLSEPSISDRRSLQTPRQPARSAFAFTSAHPFRPARVFKFFENLVDPYVDLPETDRPPQRLWPFLRQYMGPFRKVFWWPAASVVVAFVEVGLLWYLGRIVDLLETDRPGGLLGRAWLGTGAGRAFILILRPVLQVLDVGLINNDPAQFRHAHPLARASAGAAPVGRLVRERFRRPHRQPHHADPARGGRGGVPGLRRAQLFHRLYPRRGDAAGRRRPAAGDPAAGLARALCRLVRWTIRASPRLAGRADARSAVTGRVVDSLYQHPFGQAVRPSRPRTGLCPRGHRTRPPTFQKEMRIFTTWMCAWCAQRLPDRGGGRLGDLAVVRRGQPGRGRRRLGAGAAAERDDRLDHVGGVVVLPQPGRGGRRDGDHRPAHHPDRRAGRTAAGFPRGD
jgi:hypothetical protein